MALNARLRKSGLPADLREAGPAGSVVRYWQPEAFTWYGREETRRSRAAFVRLVADKGQVCLSREAGRLAGFAPGDRLEVGVNGKFLAVRQSQKGLKATRQSRGGGLQVISRHLVEQLVASGWPDKERLPVVWDDKSGMLVAAKPAAKEGEKK
jgi:hypothetical protein